MSGWKTNILAIAVTGVVLVFLYYYQQARDGLLRLSKTVEMTVEGPSIESTNEKKKPTFVLHVGLPKTGK